MATPIVNKNDSQPSKSKAPTKANSLSFATRRFAAWALEVTLVASSGLIPWGLGAYINSRNDINRVPLHPVLVVTERTIARPLALPVSYGIPNVAWPTNYLWMLALITPVTLSWWQLYLLAKTGSTLPKRWFGVRVVNEQGKPPGLGAAITREGIGRWSVPVSIAYIIWRYSFAYPNLGLLTFLAVLMVLGEGISLSSRQGRRALHDWLAGTDTIDAKHPHGRSAIVKTNEPEAPATAAHLAMAASTDTKLPTLWRNLRHNSNLSLFLVTLVSMTAVLGTLIGTQVYIQTQQTQRETQKINSEKFLELKKQLSSDSRASLTDRQSAILAIGGLNDPQSMQFLTDLLVNETDTTLLNSIQQALTTVGISAIPELKNKNQFLANELQSQAGSKRELWQQQLQRNQETINKILNVYSGKIKGIDLSRTVLSQSNTTGNSLFNLVLDDVDLSGIKFKSAELNQASFKKSRFRSVGEDGRWDTYDDAIADLSQAQMKQANFTDANLSRVLLTGSDLSRATLNRANLANARLIGANLSSAQLVGADLQGAVLENASLTGADLGDAKLNEANLYGARLGRVIAIGTQLSFANLAKTDWQGADLSGAYLDRANLSNANLIASRLTGAVLRSAQLENADLRNADLSFADLRGANVAGADFKDAILAPTKQDPADQFVETPDIGTVSAVVKGVDFSQAKNLDAKQLAYICTQGGIHPRCP